MKRKLIPLLFFLSIGLGVYAAAPKPVHDTVYINNDKQDELTAYKLLAETAQKSYEDQKETTHWFLGIIGTFLASIIVSQVILNTRFNAKLIKNLKSDFEVEIAEQKLEQNQELQSTIDDIRVEINLAIENQLNRVYSTIENAKDDYDHQLEALKSEQQKATLTTSSAIKINEGKSSISEGNYSLAINKFIDAGEDLMGAQEDVYPVLEGIDGCIHKMDEISIKKLKSLNAFLDLAIENSHEDATNMETIEEIKKSLELKKTFKMSKGVKVYL